jgi:hypothetical protein
MEIAGAQTAAKASEDFMSLCQRLQLGLAGVQAEAISGAALKAPAGF